MADERELYPMPTVAEAAFPVLREVMKREESFPRNFGEWKAMWEIRRKQEEENGLDVQFIEVNPRGFANFCKARNKPADWLALIDYLSAKARSSAAKTRQ